MVRRSVPASSRCVAQLWRTRWGVTLLRMPALLAAFAAGAPHDLVSDRLLRVAMHARGEQVGLRLEPSPVGPQRLQQRWAQRQVTILASLAVHDMNDHALAVDVGDLQPCDFGRGASRCRTEPSAACARNRLLLASIRRATSSRLRILGSFLRRLGIGQELAELMPMKRAYEQEPQRSHMVLDCSRVQLPHLEQIGLIGAKMIGTELVWGLAKVLCEAARQNADSAAIVLSE